MEQDIKMLEERFGSETISFARRGDLLTVKAVNSLGEAEIALNGAHVISYRRKDGRPVLWLSSMSNLANGKAVRGGIPVCSPWFSAHPEDKSLPMHGYARISLWRMVSTEVMADGSDRIVLTMDNSDMPDFSYMPFELVYTVTVGASLECQLQLRNTGNADLPVSAALHSYFTVGDVSAVSVTGLEGMDFINKLDGCIYREENPVKISAETDRIYIDHGNTAVISDPVLNRRIRIEKFNSYSTVVWNPWIDKSKNMPDFGDEEYPGMICVETCNCAADSRIVKPGEAYTFGCRISEETL